MQVTGEERSGKVAVGGQSHSPEGQAVPSYELEPHIREEGGEEKRGNFGGGGQV